jgi:DNA-binding NtrC family response regulator
MYVETTPRETRNSLPIEALGQSGGPGQVNGGPSLKALMNDYERRLILDALNASGWHQRKAAARLSVLPTTLLEKMKRLGIRRARSVEPLTALDLSRS